MAKQIVAGELYESLTGQLFEIGLQLRQLNGYPFDPMKLKSHLQDAIEGKFGDILTPCEFLKLISSEESLVLDESDGIETLAKMLEYQSQNKDFFTFIDSDFKNWGADEKGCATPEVSVAIYVMAKDATFSQMFGSLSPDVLKFCLTQAQIINFVKKYRNWLRTDGYATFFLFESNSHFFVADVRVYSDGELRVRVYRFEDSRVWNAGHRPRVVVSQLA